MKRTLWKRSVSMVLALLLVMPVTAMAAERFTLIALEPEEVTLDEQAFQYTGKEIRPNVTVRVQDQLLTLDRDYTLEYADNIEIGTGKVIVTGIGTASGTVGYTGTVEVSFQITKDTPAYTLVEIQGTDVTIDGTEFTYTGSPVEPKVTVRVGGKRLIRDRDYTLTFENNTEPGTAQAVVRGIATASQTLGYSGEVKLPFTIIKQEAPLPTEPETTVPETTEPETTEPIVPETTEPESTDPTVPETTEPEATEPTVPETTEPETTEPTVPETTEPQTTLPEVTQPDSGSGQTVDYKITKGSNAAWYRQSTKNLSFTANGDIKDFEGVRIDGKDLAEKYYTVESGSTVVTLKKDFLQKLSTGKHTITILFEDGKAEGTFRISEGLDTTNPETGDHFRPGLWMTVMGLSLAGGVGMIVFRKKIFG